MKAFQKTCTFHRLSTSSFFRNVIIIIISFIAYIAYNKVYKGEPEQRKGKEKRKKKKKKSRYNIIQHDETFVYVEYSGIIPVYHVN